MEMIRVTAALLLIICLLARSAASVTFEFSNKCSYTIWVGALSGSNSSPLPQTGFKLPSGSSSSLPAPPAWSRRIWGRSFCSTDASGRFYYLTGDCSTGQISCDGAGGGMDFYDISLVDGYNLPVGVAPVGGTGDCRKAGCLWDLDNQCPHELAVKGVDGVVVACKSACEAFRDPRYCCVGAYGTPTTCGPNNYSELFKRACPAAYSYVYDDRNSTFTCTGPASYTVTFCS